MRYRGITLAIVFMMALGTAFGQVVSNDTASTPYWVDMMQDPNGNFYQTQQAFYKYWDGRARDKADGFKPFKRWEWFMQYEVNPDGSYISADQIASEVRDFRDKYSRSNINKFLAVSGGVSTWEPLGPLVLPVASSGQPNGMGRINCVGIHPTNDSIMFVGAPNGGIWRTYDLGKTWESNTDTNFIMQVSSIVFDPKNPQIVYAGTGDRDAGARSPQGVMKSTDGGLHWNLANSGMGNLVVGKMIIDPDHPDTLVAATSSGIYKTTNAGATWTRRSNTANYKDIVAQPGNFKVQYATSSGVFYRSENYGNSWTSVSNGLPGGVRGAIAVTQASTNYVYFILTNQRTFKGLYLSVDSGKTFTVQSTSPNIMDYSTNGSGTGGQAWYDLDIAADPKNQNTIYVGGVNIFKSTNQGRSWQINAHWTGSGGNPAVHADQHVLEFNPNGDRLLVGNDGGVYYTENGGSSYINVSSGLVISEIYKIGQALFEEDKAMCGYQDNGSTVYRGKGDWTTEIGGDGMECAVDPTNSNYMYGELYYGAIRRSTNGGRSFSSITRNLNDQGAWVTPFMIDESNPNVMFVGMGSVWRTTNLKTNSANSVSWRDIGGNIASSNSTFRVLEQSEADPDIVYAARSDGNVFRTDNASATSPTWTNISSGIPGAGAPSDMEAHPGDPNVVYMTKSTKVYVSVNKGQSWTDISANLPNVSLRTVAYDRFSRGGLFVGGTPGVYYIDSSMTQWTGYSDGLPGDVSVTEIEIFYDTATPANSRLRAGTYGRGMWSAPLFDVGSRSPVAEIRGDTGYFCMQNALQFFSDSSKNATEWNWKFSPNTVTYVNNTTANSANVEVRFDEPGFYTVSLVASNYYGKDTVTYVNGIHVDSLYATTCATTTASSTANQRGIVEVSLAGMLHQTGTYDGINSNQDYSCSKIAHLEPSTTYNIQVTTNSQMAEFVEVYIDYNADDDFTDAGEQVISLGSSTGAHTGSFTTPVNPERNRSLRMRVISDVSSIAQPCQALSMGESEDYAVYFNEPGGVVLISDSVICPKETTWISLNPDGKPDLVTWNFGSDATPQTGMGIDPIEVSYSRFGKKYITATINGVLTVVDSLEVIKAPTADLMIDSALSSLCDGGHMRLTVPGNTGIPTTYSWYRNGIIQVSASDSFWLENNLNFFLTNEYQVVADGNGCTDTSEIIVTKPFASPTSWVSANPVSSCLSGNEFDFNDITLLSEGTLSRAWDFGDGNTSTQKDVKHSYTQAGTYLVKLVSSSEKGCMDSTDISVTVLPSPDASFTIVKKARNQFDFAPNDQTLASYQWDFGDGNQSSLTNPTHQYTGNGIFDVKLSVNNAENCDDTLSQQVEVEAELGIDQAVQTLGLELFPNPSNGRFNLSIERGDTYHITLYNALGQAEWEETLNATDGQVLQREWTVPGWYVLQVIDSQGQSQSIRLEIQ